MTFWNVFFAVLSGIVAGVIINLVVIAIMNCRFRNRAVANLKFEIDFNIESIDSLLEELKRYRDKIVADSIQIYVGYFMISQVLTTTLVKMFDDRSIYKYMGPNHIAKLQSFYKLFSIEMERRTNDQVTWAKEHINEEGVKQTVIGQIDVWEKAFKNTKADLQTVKERFELSRKERKKERNKQKKKRI